MSKLGVSVAVPAASPDGAITGQVLVRAFEELRDRLVSTLMFVLGNRDDAQDAAQEAFLKCWKAHASLPEVADLPAWIFRIAINTARDLRRSAWRRRSRPITGDFAMLATDAAPVQALEYQETLDRIRRAILDLRPDEKEVFLLRQNGELTYEQIAEMRNAPVGTVKTQMRSALMKLREVLK